MSDADVVRTVYYCLPRTDIESAAGMLGVTVETLGAAVELDELEMHEFQERDAEGAVTRHLRMLNTVELIGWAKGRGDMLRTEDLTSDEREQFEGITPPPLKVVRE